MPPHPTSSAWKIIPQFPSRSIPATIAFYTSVLGFTLGGTYTHDATARKEKQPTFASLYAGRGAVANIYFFLTPEEEGFREGRAMVALGREEVEELWERLRGLEVEGGRAREGWKVGEWGIVEEIGDKKWGYSQFTVRDGDGNQLTFFCFLGGGNPGSEEKEGKVDGGELTERE